MLHPQFQEHLEEDCAFGLLFHQLDQGLLCLKLVHTLQKHQLSEGNILNPDFVQICELCVLFIVYVRLLHNDLSVSIVFKAEKDVVLFLNLEEVAGSE